MLRCRMHIRVSAEPMSLVAPVGSKVLLTRGRDTPTPVPAPFVQWEQVVCDRDEEHWDALGTL